MKVTLDKAVELIKRGEIVAFPTETVYGLGADAKNIEAIKKTFEAKGRPSDNPLIVHISNLEQLNRLAIRVPEQLYTLAKAFWPGPLSIIVRKKPDVPDIVTAGLPTVAIRMPNHPVALQLIEKTGPLTAPSANKSGRPSPTRPDHLSEDYGESLPILEGEHSTIGLESTVINILEHPPVILRPGAISEEMIANVLGTEVVTVSGESATDTPAMSPGTKYTHYKPEARVSWIPENSTSKPGKDSLWLVHSNKPFRPSRHIIAYHNNFDQMAAELFDQFRRADKLGYQNILIEPLPSDAHHPIISALRNRIQKAIG